MEFIEAILENPRVTITAATVISTGLAYLNKERRRKRGKNKASQLYSDLFKGEVTEEEVVDRHKELWLNNAESLVESRPFDYDEIIRPSLAERRAELEIHESLSQAEDLDHAGPDRFEKAMEINDRIEGTRYNY